ncbi:MAG TPA: peptidase U32 family protein [Burkholderiales bacterium]|nr:peptidase U32 family protein [Burkholderiales bacterium]
MAEDTPIELVCPAGGLPALQAAVDAGADWVYAGLRDDTNARNFPALNFDDASLAAGLRYAHQRGRKVVLAINTYPQAHNWTRWTDAIDRAQRLGADAVIVADPGLLRYAHRKHPKLELHLSVQGSATSYEAINFFHQQFGIRRAVLPRVLSLAQLELVASRTPVEMEVFGFGGLCVMVEGRCSLSGYACGTSPNMAGACSPAHAVRWAETPLGLESRLNGVLIDRYGKREHAAYPTVCKGRYESLGETYHAFEEPASLNTLELLPEFARIGVRAVKLEGRQRSPAYVAQVTRIWREAIDALARAPARFRVQPQWRAELARLAEGSQQTLGAFSRPWK